MDELVASDGLVGEACRIRDDVESSLTAWEVPGEVELTGGLSVPGTLTRGDVDLHLRVDPEAFDAVVARLREVLPVASPQSWAATLAVFEVPGPLPTGLAVTPLHSEHDRRFRLAWEALRRDPELLARYNALKSETVGTGDYEERKSRFFTAIVDAHPSGRSGGPG